MAQAVTQESGAGDRSRKQPKDFPFLIYHFSSGHLLNWSHFKIEFAGDIRQ